MQYVLGNMLNGGGINPDGLSLDLQFAADKTLTARRGPTPVFTRSSGDNGGTTYFGPLVDFDLLAEIPAIGITNGRASWFKSDGGNDITISYTGTRWRVVVAYNGTEDVYLAAPGSEWRPDQADWSGQDFSVTTSGTFGIVKAANNEPRFDHTPAGVCRGLLIEEGRTNLCLQSNAFSTSPWANINSACAISQNETGPDGIANSAWTFTDDSMDRAEGRYLEASLTSGVVYSLSVFVKKTTGTPSTYPAIWLARSGTLGGCVINTTAGTATAITSFSPLTIMSTTASVVDSGNFWRVTSLITPNVTGSWEISISPSGNGNGTGVFDVTATGSAVFWGAQLEAGSFATSYIPTTTGSAVRSADVCSITGGNFNNFYNQSEGSVFFNGSSAGRSTSSTYGDAAFRLNIFSDPSNRIGMLAASGTSRVEIASGNVAQYNANRSYSNNTGFKQTLGYSSGQLSSGFIDNVSMTATGNIALTSPNVVSMAIGGSGAGGNQINGHIAAIRYYKKRLPDAKLAQLTV